MVLGTAEIPRPSTLSHPSKKVTLPTAHPVARLGTPLLFSICDPSWHAPCSAMGKIVTLGILLLRASVSLVIAVASVAWGDQALS